MMKNSLSIALIVTLGFLFFSAQCTERKSVNLRELAKQPNTVVIDVRTIDEFAAGHVEQSINIPLQVLPDSIESLKRYENIILVCRSGNRSGQAKRLLEDNGFENVYNGGGWASF